MRKATYIFMLITVALSSAATLPFQGFGPFTTITRVAAIPMLFFWILYRAGDQRFRAWNITFSLSCLFYLWIWVTVLWTPNIDYGPIAGLTPATGFIIAFVAWDLVKTKEEAQAVVQALLYGVCLTFLYMLLQYFKGNQYYDSRLGGAAFDPNEVAFYSLILLPIVWYIGNTDRKYPIFNRFLNLAYPGICFAIVLLTGSRGGFVIGLPAFGYVFFTIRKGLRNPLAKKPLTWALGLSVAAGVLLVVKSGIAKYAVHRFSGISLRGDKLSGRLDAWRHAIQLWVQHPVRGTGLAGFRLYSNHYAMEKVYSPVGMPIHNTPLGILSDYGLIGFAFYAAVILSIWWLARSCQKELKIALTVFLVVFVLGSMDISEELRQQFYVFYLVIVGYAYTLRDHSIMEYYRSLKTVGSIRRTTPRVTAIPVE